MTFALVVNGERVATAGIPGDGGLHAIVMSHTRPDRASQLDLTLSGLDANRTPKVHQRWAEVALAIGDRIELRIADGDVVDPPVERYESSPPPAREERTVEALREMIAKVEERIARCEKNVADAPNEPFSTAKHLRFEVARDGVRLVSAGLPGDGVLSVIVSARCRRESAEVECTVGGLTADWRDLTWIADPLSAPTTLTIVVDGGGEIDTPRARSDQPPWSDEELKGVRAHLERLRAELEALEALEALERGAG